MTLVVGVGNPHRGDDAIGHAVVSAIQALGPPGVRTLVRTEPLDLVDVWAGEPDVVVVDALEDPTAAPGTVLTLGPDDPRIAESAPVGTHTVGLAAVLALAHRLGRRPDRVVVVGVVGASFAAGAPLSDGVAAAVPVAVAAALGGLVPRQDSGGPRT